MSGDRHVWTEVGDGGQMAVARMRPLMCDLKASIHPRCKLLWVNETDRGHVVNHHLEEKSAIDIFLGKWSDLYAILSYFTESPSCGWKMDDGEKDDGKKQTTCHMSKRRCISEHKEMH